MHFVFIFLVYDPNSPQFQSFPTADHLPEVKCLAAVFLNRIDVPIIGEKHPKKAGSGSCSC